jgi:hypothetical protein
MNLRLPTLQNDANSARLEGSCLYSNGLTIAQALLCPHRPPIRAPIGRCVAVPGRAVLLPPRGALRPHTRAGPQQPPPGRSRR